MASERAFKNGERNSKKMINTIKNGWNSFPILNYLIGKVLILDISLKGINYEILDKKSRVYLKKCIVIALQFDDEASSGLPVIN